MLARGAHHESERAAHEQAYTEQQRGHAEDARGGWLRGQERRSRTLGVVVRVGRGVAESGAHNILTTKSDFRADFADVSEVCTVLRRPGGLY